MYIHTEAIARWGNFMALKILKSVAEVCGLKAGTPVIVRTVGQR